MMFKLSLRSTPAFKAPFKYTSIFTRRNYHSYDHEDEPILNPDSPQYKILDKALNEFVPKYGFQHKAILESSRTFGFSDAIQSLFVNGTFDLIKFHLVKERLNLTKYLELEEFQKLSNENEKLKYLVKKRLLANSPIAEHLNQLQAHLVLPPNLSQSSDELHQLSDDLRFYSGDKSNDFAWYTKRLSLSSSYVALELFMSQDKSNGFQHTLDLTEKRLNDIDSLGGLFNDAEEFLSYTFHSSLNLLKSQASRG